MMDSLENSSNASRMKSKIISIHRAFLNEELKSS